MADLPSSPERVQKHSTLDNGTAPIARAQKVTGKLCLAQTAVMVCFGRVTL